MLRKPTYDSEEYSLAFQRGEEKGFDFFYRELYPSLCFFANRITKDIFEAEDIVSHAFIKIWQRHSQFNNAKNIRAYLYQIVRNDCLKFLNQKSRLVEVQNEIRYLSAPELNNNCEADIIRAEFYGQLYKAIETLPTECRKIFKLLYIQGKTVKETSHELNLSVSTVKTQKARGLVVLRKKLITILLAFFLHII